MKNKGVVIRDVIRDVTGDSVSDISNPYTSGMGIQTKIGGYILTKLGFRIKIK